MKRPSKRSEMTAIALAITFLAAVIAAAIFQDKLKTNFGFGPEWDCKPQGYGDPVCVKR